MSFRPIDDADGGDGGRSGASPPRAPAEPEAGESAPEGRNAERGFHGARWSNETHRSTTDEDARLYRKGRGKEARLGYMGHALMENRNGLAVDGLVSPGHRRGGAAGGRGDAAAAAAPATVDHAGGRQGP